MRCECKNKDNIVCTSSKSIHQQATMFCKIVLVSNKAKRNHKITVDCWIRLKIKTIPIKKRVKVTLIFKLLWKKVTLMKTLFGARSPKRQHQARWTKFLSFAFVSFLYIIQIQIQMLVEWWNYRKRDEMVKIVVRFLSKEFVAQEPRNCWVREETVQQNRFTNILEREKF